MQKMDMDNACPIFETGPCTVVYGGDSIVDVAKEVIDWAKKLKDIKPKSAFVEGVVMTGEGVKDLSKMPTRTELQGQVVQLVSSPGSNVAGALLGPGGVIAGCVKSLIEKLEEAA
jgi:large subunit ribosomal protein L10